MSSIGRSKQSSIDASKDGSMRIATDGESINEVFARARRGDRTAFGQLVMMVQDRLYNAVYRMTGDPDEAADLTQETFAKSLEHIGTFRGESQPYTWMFRIALNLVLSKRRSMKVRHAVSIDSEIKSNTGDDQMSRLRERLASNDRSPGEQAEHNDRLRVVSDALNKIEPEDRALLVMRDIDGLDYNEMASVLEIPLGTLKSKLFRARMSLRDMVTQLGG